MAITLQQLMQILEEFDDQGDEAESQGPQGDGRVQERQLTFRFEAQGPKVKSRKQAIAIAMSEARKK